MLSLETEARLVRLLMAIAHEELILDTLRENLIEIPEFEPYAAFQYLDKESHGFLTAHDLKSFLQ